MRKHKIIFIISIIAICFVAYYIYYINAKDCIGTAKDNITSKATSGCGFSYKGKKNEKLEFKYITKIESGTVKFQIINSKDKVVKEFGGRGEGKNYAILNSDDNYIIKASYKNFKGKFNLSAYAVHAK